MRIVTQRPKIPWVWAFFIGLPWILPGLADRISGEPLTFTLRKFIDDPAELSAIASYNILFNFLVGVVAAYVSDHIWTRWGRRRPFVIGSALGAGTLLLFIPNLGTLPVLVATIIAYQFCVDLGRPWEPLFNEVIPPAQRGRAGIFRMLSVNLTMLFFSSALIAHWDREYQVGGGWMISGEEVVYYVVAAILYGIALFLLIFVREERPADAAGYRATGIRGVQWNGPRFRSGLIAWDFIRDMFDRRQALWVYLLYVAPVIGGAGAFHALVTLVITDDIGISKAQLGYPINFVSGALMLAVFTPAAGFLADYVSRLWMMRVGLLGIGATHAAFYVYLGSVDPSAVTVGVVLALYVLIALFSSLMWAVWGPLVFDYIPSSRMGTYLAGITFTAGVIAFGLVRLGGLWVAAFQDAGQPVVYRPVLLFSVGCALLGVLPTVLFGLAERRGWVVPEGRLEAERASAVDPV